MSDVTDMVEIDTLPSDSIYSKIWQPFIAKWTDDHYVTSYGLQLRDKGDMGDLGDLVCSISKDRGKTWISPRLNAECKGEIHCVPVQDSPPFSSCSVSHALPTQRVRTFCSAFRTTKATTTLARTAIPS